MISYSLKSILELVPEALPFVKQASLEEDFPLGNESGCIASALRVEYAKHRSHEYIDPDVLTKVASAVEAYGATSKVEELTSLLLSRRVFTKSAAEAGSEFLTKQAGFEGDFTGRKDLQLLEKQATELYDEAIALGQEPSEFVQRYSGNTYLHKQAAVEALGARYQATGSPVFIKLASALGTESKPLLEGRVVQSLCRTVTGLDKQAGLDLIGFDFYKEALIEKSAATSALSVKVGGQMVPLEKILRIPRHHLTNYLGGDISKEIDSDPVTAKAVIESLPADLQQVLLSILKSC